MQDLIDPLVELVRLTSTDLPHDIERALKNALSTEKQGSSAASVLEAILENIKVARSESTPVCQDTGTPLFVITHPTGWSTAELREQVRRAVARATESRFLRPNAVNAVTGENSGNNLGGEFFPVIHFEEHENDALVVDLVLKGGGSENVSAQYSLPDQMLDAGRDLEGVYRAAMDAVFKAQGMGCAPGFIGVAAGGDRSSSYLAARKALLRCVGSENPDPDLSTLEQRILHDANLLGIGPMGLGGRTTLLAVHAAGLHRLPASYFVSISYMCWAFRRRRMVLRENDAVFPEFISDREEDDHV